jgi:hypothetical protein
MNEDEILNLGFVTNQTLWMFQMKMTTNGRWPQMEDYLKYQKLVYLSNYWSDLPQILTLGLYDQTKLYECFKWTWPPME